MLKKCLESDNRRLIKVTCNGSMVFHSDPTSSPMSDTMIVLVPYIE